MVDLVVCVEFAFILCCVIVGFDVINGFGFWACFWVFRVCWCLLICMLWVGFVDLGFGGFDLC